MVKKTRSISSRKSCTNKRTSKQNNGTEKQREVEKLISFKNSTSESITLKKGQNQAKLRENGWGEQ